MKELSLQLFRYAGEAGTPGPFLAKSLEAVASATGADASAVIAAEAGQWKPVATSGNADRPPIDLAADGVDQERICRAGLWLAVPLNSSTHDQHAAPLPTAALALHGCDLTDDIIQPVADALAAAWNLARDGYHARRRIRRLEAILAIAQRWYQVDDLSDLFEQMAQAATELLEADRASIFLWDQKAQVLVGRPALGIAGGELRIPDDAGVVGKVLTSGEPQRVNTTTTQDPINRTVDRDTGYATETLLCVPLTSASGERFGVFEVLNKRNGGFTAEDETGLIELARHAAVALERTQQFESLVVRHRQLVDENAAGAKMIGECPAIDALQSTIHRVADTDLAVLILGENGTGKEIAAQQIHYLSRRRDESFIAVNCAAIAETLLESELFGHERGAFTDAHETRQGKFELASGGTLLLDEIGDMSLAGQAKLLRVLEEKTIVRVGGSTPIHTDVRIVAATNQNLTELVREKRFRQDLYFRLNVVTVELPPLRDRGEDVFLLAEHFLDAFCRNMGRRTPKLTAAARRKLLSHAWPGNIRELRNLMERIAYLSPGTSIDVGDLAPSIEPVDTAAGLLDTDQSLGDATQQFQVEYIRRMIGRTRGNISNAAARLGLHRSNLYRKMRQLGMEPEDRTTDD